MADDRVRAHVKLILTTEAIGRLFAVFNIKKRIFNKMREIVHVQAGQCGNQIGSKVQ